MSPTGLDFLSRRYLAEQRREKPRCYGVSSNALATYALGLGPRPQVPGTPLQGEIRAWVGEECGNAYPADECDLAACERTFEMAPPHLQERMRPVLDEFTAWVRERRNPIWGGRTMIDLAQVEAHDTRIQAEVVEPWRFGVCDLCTYLECVADVHVCWRSAVDRRDHEAYINRGHLDAWVTGFLLSDLGDPDRYRDPVLVKIGGTT